MSTYFCGVPQPKPCCCNPHCVHAHVPGVTLSPPKPSVSDGPMSWRNDKDRWQSGTLEGGYGFGVRCVDREFRILHGMGVGGVISERLIDDPALARQLAALLLQWAETGSVKP